MKKTSSRQPRLLKRQIPQMPEGYYSPGPNPNLRRFVEEHSTSYNPAADHYRVKPFDQQINIENRRNPINDLHIYWSKKPHDAIRQYIKHYTKPGDLVLDPFCGSGGTALAALMEDRAAIAIDLSPAATFITKNYCTPVDPDELHRAFEELKAKVTPEMCWLYETRCDRCDGRATTAYTVYSYVFQCPRCLEKVPLFDCEGVQSQTPAGKPKTISVCPYCYARDVEEEISTRSQRFDPVPVLVSYLCEEGCKPLRAERRHNDPDPKKREYFQKYDLGKLAEIEKKPIPHWIPPNRMMNVESDTEPWGDKWRAGTSNFRTVAELFTKRNLWALALLSDHLNSITESPKESLKFAFSGSIFNATKMYQQREAGGGPQKGTYYIPQVFREVKVWTLFDQKVSNLLNAAPLLERMSDEPKLSISTQTATRLCDISGNSIDYIFTDPPYAGNVQYGELNFTWEAWMSFDTSWHDEEIIVNETRRKTDDDWADLMRQAMKECFRILKPGRWVSICYHDTSEGTWQLMQDLMTEVGFIPEKSDVALSIGTGQKSYNQLVAEKVTKRDLVINFRKPRPGEISGQLGLFDPADLTTFQDAARLILTEALTNHPGQSADRLYDELVSRTVRQGVFERHNFDALLRSVAEESPTGSGRWYLLATAGEVDDAESAKEDAAAAKLEAYMQKFLKENRTETGVHYSDLFEQYLPVKDKPRRLLQEWLPEFFFKTADGTWRPPLTDEERSQKAALRSSGALRRIKRFANALLEGVPPYERDKPENAATLADWIRQCRRAGLYELGRALYEKGGLRFDGLGEVAQIEVEEDYQVCVRRSENVKRGKREKGKASQGKLDL